MRHLLTITATAASLAHYPLAAADLEPLTYNKNIWQLSPSEISSKFPDFNWRDQGKNTLKSSADDLKFMGLSIQSASLQGASGKTDSIELGIYQKGESQTVAPSQFSHATVAWKQHLDQATGKVGRRLPIVSKESESIQRTTWEFQDSIAVLTATRTPQPDSLKLTILSRSAASAFLKASEPNKGPNLTGNPTLASFKGKTSILKSGKLSKENITGSPEYFLLYFSASW